MALRLMRAAYSAGLIFIAAVGAHISAADDLPLHLMVKQTGVYAEDNSTLHQCLTSLKDAVRDHPRTRPIIVSAGAKRQDYDALVVAKNLEWMGFKSVERISKTGGWTLYPPVPPNMELASCHR